MKVRSSREVTANWQAIKGREAEDKGKKKSVLGNLPRSLPALQRAFRLGERASRAGFDWESPEAVLDKLDEEARELKEAIKQGDPGSIEDELGDLLFAVANLSRKLAVNPEDALRKALDKFTARFQRMEKRILSQGREMRDLLPEELDRAWEMSKR